MFLVHLLLSILSLLLLACQSEEDSGPEAQLVSEVELLTAAGQKRYFDYYRPPSLPAGSALVIVYHGGQGNSAGLVNPQSAQSHWLQIADEQGLTIAFPNGTDPENGLSQGEQLNWNDCRTGSDTTTADDVGFTLALINWAATNLSINRNQVFLSGASNGGMMSMRVATEAPNSIRAFASFIANQPNPSECAQPSTPVPALFIHGTEDPLIPYSGGCIQQGARGCVRSAPATVAIWRDAHAIDPNGVATQDYPDINNQDASTARSIRYRDASGQTRLQSIIIDGGGHQIPSIAHRRNAALAQSLGPQNADLEAVREAWAFFAQFRD